MGHQARTLPRCLIVEADLERVRAAQLNTEAPCVDDGLQLRRKRGVGWMRPTQARDFANAETMLQRGLAGPAIGPRRGLDEEEHRFGETIAIGTDMNRARRGYVPWHVVPACKWRTAHR